jgi:hypothetical protein
MTETIGMWQSVRLMLTRTYESSLIWNFGHCDLFVIWDLLFDILKFGQLLAYTEFTLDFYILPFVWR